MNDLDAIERLHALKVKGYLTEEEFAWEKERLFNQNENSPRSPFNLNEAELDADSASYDGASDGEKIGKIVVASALFCSLVASAWWLAGKPTLLGNGDTPLAEYVVGGWAPFDPNRSLEENCATDVGWTFHADGKFVALDQDATWFAKDERSVIIEDADGGSAHAVVRIDDNHYRHENTEMVRCPPTD